MSSRLTLSQKTRWKEIKETPNIYIWPLYMHVHTHEHYMYIFTPTKKHRQYVWCILILICSTQITSETEHFYKIIFAKLLLPLRPASSITRLCEDPLSQQTKTFLSEGVWKRFTHSLDRFLLTFSLFFLYIFSGAFLFSFTISF